MPEDMLKEVVDFYRTFDFGPRPWWNPTLSSRYHFARKRGYSDKFAMIYMNQAPTEHKA